MIYQPHEGRGYGQLATHEINKNASGLVENDKCSAVLFIFFYNNN